MKKYISFFRIRFIHTLQYRAAAFAGATTQLFWGVMEIMVFAAFYKSNMDTFPMKMQDISSYVWLNEAFISLFMMWGMDNEIFAAIRDGNVAYELSRPMDIYNMWLTKNIAIRLSKCLLRCIPIFIVGFLVPKPYGIILPPSIYQFILFTISLVLGFLVLNVFCMIMYIITFYTISPTGLRIVVTSFSEFLTGMIIPLPFFPDYMQNFLSILPWASMQNAPYRIYSGNIVGNEAIYTIALQLIWLLVLTFIGKLMMTKALKKVVIQGS